ncbi:hypothetical protein [Chitinophaga sancti]|uniref:Uncharacterized protein n=1 Tax=Chitinophaga sancti TaxID=1004 RepID=A0A1K1S4T3_9BACT|nr:hypothetical protein [Chitinophaga sancti]WQD63679.1 hypothetical protein U0033_04670 [Chitinophaga sancti]WQG90696.1 hypothetical protein SR876_04250 [Chitinophaga sancti]SFW79361.1 hypothetical protein SAMN05661012_04785 [Chitinophaga sancti]
MKQSGINKWVAVPAVLFVFSLFGTYFSYAAARQHPSYFPVVYVCVGIAVCSFIVAAIMQNGTIKQRPKYAPIPFSTDHSETYYCIYTTGKRKYDVDFIEDIADRIEHIDEEHDPLLSAQIAELFNPERKSPVLLPAQLTNGEEVYQRPLKSSQLVDDITRNERHFALLTFEDHSTALVVRHEQLM